MSNHFALIQNVIFIVFVFHLNLLCHLICKILHIFKAIIRKLHYTLNTLQYQTNTSRQKDLFLFRNGANLQFFFNWSRLMQLVWVTLDLNWLGLVLSVPTRQLHQRGSHHPMQSNKLNPRGRHNGPKVTIYMTYRFTIFRGVALCYFLFHFCAIDSFCLTGTVDGRCMCKHYVTCRLLRNFALTSIQWLCHLKGHSNFSNGIVGRDFNIRK